ncbi:putative type IX secretion system sortase PorU2 [Ohtaekwangia koreensis]|uniref:CARDB protein n=1 Tax=Ohtaekwangia koreensis TaxID=688867 RepID=A0A1T5MKE3_9BACT|nr:C25 family cysteine peptidase [Ohtaekwangia koreensis]SKC88676.1 CARDB protein [Ohtaekwangia koreensis]
MNRIFSVLLIFSAVVRADAQMGNEWIDFGQSYFKIPVGKDGIYKLDYSSLQAAGFPVGSVDPKKIQLFHRGIEQAIYIEGEDDGQFNSSDFIEFYGRRNDGTLDADLYKPSSLQPHKYYNLYSDTTSYFLTASSLSGKRMVSFSENNTSGLSAESYHFDEKLLVFVNELSQGTDYNVEMRYTFFDRGEGFTGSQVVQAQFIDYTFSDVTNTVTSASPPTLELLLVGRGPMAHAVEIYAGAGQRLIGTVNFSGYDAYTYKQDLAWSDVATDGTLPIRIKVIGTGGTDRVSASYMKLRYAQQTTASSLSEKVFNLAANVAGKSYIEIQNPAVGLRLFDVTDPSSVVKIGTTSSSTLNAVVPSTSISRKIFSAAATLSAKIKPVKFRSINPHDYNYVIISHPMLRTAAGGYSDPVKAYAEYRASTAGGNYDTLVVNIGQLYDQFNYGEISSRAIYKFMQYLAGTSLPRYLFIIGKGLDYGGRYHRNPTAAGYATYKDLVPTAGHPGSDAYYTAGLSGTTDEPAVPTGRITATNAAQVAAYLNKVIETEAKPFDDLRRKNVLHLSGGIEEGEPELFRSFLEDYATIATSYHLGGKVSAIAKRSTDIELINIAEEVNKGLNLITFFGHASATTLDFDIGYVTDPVMGYNNPNKYPMLIMNGCSAGAFFSNKILFGEDWVLAANKGATAFIAHSAYGFVSNLRIYSEMFYKVGFGDSVFIHKGIGDIHKETARRHILQTGSSLANTSQVQQMILLGDPAVPLFGASKPDLEIKDDNIYLESFDGGDVTALTDSFALKIIVRNFGQAKEDTMRIEVKRYLNDNSLIVYDSLYPSTLYSDTLTFVVRKGREDGSGNNRFEITLDPDGVITELSETNNTASFTLPIALNGTKNLFPSNFSIVHTKDLPLSFQTSDLLSNEREFIVELDTVNTFDSQFKKTFTIKGTVLGRQTIALIEADTLAYYWRTKLSQPLAGESDAWTLSTFTYIDNGPEGWAQVHFPQYLTNTTEGLVQDAALRKLNFKETVTSLDIKIFGSAYGATYLDYSYKIGGAEYNLYRQGYVCRSNTINLIAFDKRSTSPYVGIPFKWYNSGLRSCGRSPWVINSFYYTEMITNNNDDIRTYVDNIAEGDSVVLFNLGDAYYQNWPAAAKTKLGELGISVTQIDALVPGEPVVIFGKKGTAPGTAKFIRTSGTPANKQVLTVSGTITGGYTSGTMESKLIGPAKEWESFIANTRNVESQDAMSFDILGIKLNGEEEIIYQDIVDDLDLSSIDAGVYPYLKLVYKTGDNINLTPAQLEKWLVLYTPVPEGLLVFKNNYEPQTISEGEVWEGTYGFINISDKEFTDSLSVRYELFNKDQRVSQLEYIKIKPPAPGDTSKFSLNISTSGMVGLNDVNVFVNPQVEPEQYYDNNVLSLTDYLNVTLDEFAPVLDVTIDDRHVLNGDFVSSNPFILVRVWDENKKNFKHDLEGMKVYLTYPCEEEDCSPTPIDLTSAEVTWYPATETSDFRIEFKPTNLPEGKYTLRVEASDARNNSSGADPYLIDFVVSKETSITVSEPYPNPSASEFYFRIIMSGESLPENFNLELVDVNGKLLHAFSQDDIADFHIGVNNLKWDGTDLNGNTMPDGVYIYKLQLNLNGSQITREGKLVLLK